MDTYTHKELVEQLCDAFETRARDNGHEFVCLKDEAPSWIDENDIMLSVHQGLDGRLPDDWVYEITGHVCCRFCELDTLEEMREWIPELADTLTECYNGKLAAWLAENLNNGALVDEACEELGVPDSIYKAIAQGQYIAIERIASALLDAIEDLEIEEGGEG